ncbi:hypothetical protein [Ileibacterium valens]|uniref:Pesticidal crystal protein Cry22Aa Ig-like domain-containing protein n=1 Tax=Ileibacterium valens TaxID=1862668 RepID=A0A1U7NGE0_9FIRM|nr:hypothetical protein [Ileibacterium valens]OLU37657.1 hypothetical protein BO224_10460 [Erysipelotrichaceae bacterium NYU-BL-E8]OLU40089.1 hypothetical protein BO222_05700 [Ileibacterium valens]OLU43181.1 hypothetical protein BM735_00855 [Erysipelotrichaceae bacterium NYU-BL-F16]
MKKKIIYFSTVLCLGLGLTGCFATGEKSLDIPEEKTYELGETVMILPKNFISGESELDENQLENLKVESDLMTSSQYDYNGFKGEVKTVGKDYLGIGEYDVTLIDGDHKYPVKITVRDTQAPDFIMAPLKRVVAVGSTEEEVLKAYKAEDKDEVNLSLKGDYDLETPGSYTVIIHAEDPSGNIKEQEITLNVTGDGAMITADDTSDLDITDIPQTDNSTTNQQTDITVDIEEEPVTDETVTQPEETPAPDSSTPDTGTTDTTTPACTVSQAPAGAVIYYSFDEAYAAGLAWNQQDPKNYFYYLQGVDDCGNPVYLITMGTKSEGDGF